MRKAHGTSSKTLREIQKKGIPTALWRGKLNKNGAPELNVWGEEKGIWILETAVDSSTERSEPTETLLSSNTNKPAQQTDGGPKGVDPVIQALAERAKTDPGLKRLMERVANSEETSEELKILHKHINELKAGPQSLPNALDQHCRAGHGQRTANV
jgi:hypothetical protein